MDVRIQLVCNAKSGGGTDDGEVTLALKRHGATMVDADPERVVVAGGDGTVGQGAELSARLGVPLGVVPTGTANDFARATGLSTDFEAAVALAATGTQTVALELGRANGRPFLNTASTGLAATAGRRAAPLKRVLGPVAYPVAAAVAGAVDSAVRCTARADGRTVFEGEAWQVIVASTGAFGGGAEIDAAHPADGLLDLVILPAGPRSALPQYAVAMRRGTIADHPGTVHERAAELVLSVPAGTRFNVDGELVDLGAEVTFRAEANAVQLVNGP